MKYRSLCDGFLEDGNDFQRKLSAFITEYTEIPTQSTLRTFLCGYVLQNFLCVLLSPSTLCASVLKILPVPLCSKNLPVISSACLASGSLCLCAKNHSRLLFSVSLVKFPKSKTSNKGYDCQHQIQEEVLIIFEENYEERYKYHTDANQD